MTNWDKAVAFVEHMVDTYGVRSCFDNVDEDNTLEDEGLWFECPECGDPILIFDDYNLDEVIDGCPICECTWDDLE